MVLGTRDGMDLLEVKVKDGLDLLEVKKTPDKSVWAFLDRNALITTPVVPYKDECYQVFQDYNPWWIILKVI